MTFAFTVKSTGIYACRFFQWGDDELIIVGVNQYIEKGNLVTSIKFICKLKDGVVLEQFLEFTYIFLILD